MTERSALSSAASSSFEPLDSAPALLAAARRAGLQITTEMADFDRSGLDFLVVHAHDEEGVPWVVRTPRRMAVVESARVEARVLGLVRGHLPVAVPHWRVFTEQVIAYPRLGGVPAVTVDPAVGVVWNRVDPAAPSETFIHSFAEALAALQKVSVRAIEEAGVPRKSIDDTRVEIARAMDETREILATPDVVWARWQRWLANDAIWPRHLALVHGDLHPGHMLLDEEGRLTGILDWTEAHLGDPSIDFALFVGAFGKAALDACLERFEAAGGTTWSGLAAHAAERWAAFPALGAKWGLTAGNDGAIEFARTMLATIEKESG
ncbi:macrolide 2'-phosphotransferase [Polyangium jinanense]|uniref:Macrolide 2'-phosphotransferase n=1 Tax=Polyangium jinanense TaxID=2829994 RepID=A0A9X4AZ27_9BACT|nr:macrolide 2'-phosphotransferase [Polyangium jinanense]MDC3961474.1 macrolide 2'-phosphotransferase [Polyangium jinanense]MDC3987905.1 macrolide 2'-phosphotransferase [Polyangium jinanense]